MLQPGAEDRGELAGTSSGIPSSVASSSQNQLVNTPPDESGPSKESGWKTAYGAARIAVDNPQVGDERADGTEPANGM